MTRAFAKTKGFCSATQALQMSSWKSTIGLEIHAQIATRTKLFSAAETGFGLPTNSGVNLLDAGIPGTLPCLNKTCVELAVKSALALSCTVNPVSYFDRKHYFYADLPCGYQITQQRTPIASNGHLDFHVYTPGVHKSPYRKKCRLKQVQIEQDSGKSLHDQARGTSLIDLNRAGVGLMEFVFEPDLQDGEEAAALVKELVLILQRLGSCSCKLEEGALRVDANISISNDPSKLGTRTEVKNIGSIRGVANAIKFEVQRQLLEVKSGRAIINETRGWDPQKKETVQMRDKKEDHDYRFMPEPNLPPLRVAIGASTPPAGVLDLRHVPGMIPELPETSRSSLMDKYGFTDIYAIMLVNQPALQNVFNSIMAGKSSRNPKLAWNVLMVQLLNVLNNNNLVADECPVGSAPIGEVIDLLEKGHIDFETGRNILELKLLGSKSTPSELVAMNDWRLVCDPEKIEAICLELIARNPKAVKKCRKGKQKALQVIVNDVVNLTSKKINLSLVSKRLKEMLCAE